MANKGRWMAVIGLDRGDCGCVKGSMGVLFSHMERMSLLDYGFEQTSLNDRLSGS